MKKTNQVFAWMVAIWIVVMLINILAMTTFSVMTNSPRGTLPKEWAYFNVVFTLFFLVLPGILFFFLNVKKIFNHIKKIINDFI